MVSSSNSFDSVTKHNTTNESVVSLDKEQVVTPHNIATVKWQDIRRSEDLLVIANAAAREIVENALTKIYEIYLDKKSYDFVVACSEVAFMQYFNVGR